MGLGIGKQILNVFVEITRKSEQFLWWDVVKAHVNAKKDYAGRVKYGRRDIVFNRCSKIDMGI